jgi:HlyD family secretion protein
MKLLGKRPLSYLGLAVGAIGVAWIAVHFGRAGAEGKNDLQTLRADRGPIVAKVTATGTLSALVTVQVGSQVSGAIQEILVDFNSPVKKGQVLARLDPRLVEAALGQARANHMAAEANVMKAKAQKLDADHQYDRAKSLVADKVTSQADADTALANANVAAAEVEAAQGAAEQTLAALNQAEVNLAFTTIVSPVDGIVISRNVDVGQTVAASLQAPTLFLIAEDLRKMQVDTSVAEADIGKLRDGMPASFTVDAYLSHLFHGKVRQIRNAPQSMQNVVTYDAVIDVDNPELELKPGMTASVTLIHAEKANVLRVPNAALRFRPPAAWLASESNASAGPSSDPASDPGGNRSSDRRRTVWVSRGGKPIPVGIETGISDGTLTEVAAGGLEEGDSLIVDVTSASGKPDRSGAGRTSSYRQIF